VLDTTNNDNTNTTCTLIKKISAIPLTFDKMVKLLPFGATRRVLTSTCCAMRQLSKESHDSVPEDAVEVEEHEGHNVESEL
jgi:hypothetical protein